ncbi:YafY family protein [Mesorhizobium sp. WSM3859]|uniref:helix-turn-helix transcriptional regulator n=1 Tax=Mesorhizobium sp. WSM3859 TaxID=2029402 RepID=UPI000BAEE098|nr:YafY family protein [Mesorhizobium sp. WSM3859]PBC08120.1 transcriptional regulator [Mesorhizobium sp. WSM3859]
MSRSERLLDLIQILRRHRRPVSGRTLADEMGVSIRTLYRDIATLQGQGAPIDGEAGLGYVLKPGFMLPPLMFTDEEIEAIVLGSRWVAKQPDKRLATSAADALAKIAAVLPGDLRDDLDATTLLVGPRSDNLEAIDLGVVRQAIREERKLGFLYRDAGGSPSKRVVWPFALAFFDKVRVMAAWCETRQDFRHFRADRMSDLTATGIRYPRRRQSMLKEWRATLNGPDQNRAKDASG